MRKDKRDCFASLAMMFLFVFIPGMCFAAENPSTEQLLPVQSVALSYNINSASLHVEAAHPSNNWDRDYVRMMTVALNGQVVSTLNYYHQTEPQGFSDDVNLTAQPGDVITVTVYSTEGNSISKDLTVSKPGEPSADQGDPAGGT